MDLTQYTVLEVGEYVAVPYAGKLLSGLGADVIKVEPPEGDVSRRIGPFGDGNRDRDRSGFFAYLNTDKRSATLDPNTNLAADIIHDLIETFEIDLVIEEELSEYGVIPHELADAYDDLSVVSITGFGATGPWQEYEAPEIVATAESGQMNKMGYPDRPPTRLRIKAADYIGAEYAALAGLAALFHRDVQGRKGQYIDVSRREAGTSSMEYFLPGYSWSGQTTQRLGSGYPHQGRERGIPSILEAKDGYFSTVPIPEGQWEAFCEQVIERPELTDDERFATLAARNDHLDEVREIVEGYTKQHSKWELLEEFQAAGIASTVTTNPEDIVEFDQLEAREFWQEVPLPSGETVTMPGFPFRVNRRRVEMGRAPQHGEHNTEIYSELEYDLERLASTQTEIERSTDFGTPTPPVKRLNNGPKPLDSIKVVDFTWIGAGPQSTKFLAGLGADVVKIESLQKPDTLRFMRTFEYDPEETMDASPFFGEFNQDKRSIQLNLNSERGRKLARGLIEEADVLAENFSPGYMERIGLDYENVRDINPEIIYLSMPGWGKEGPAKGYRSYGLNLQSMAGLDWISGFPDDPPTASGQSWPDPVAGTMGSVAVMMGLLHRADTGESSYIEVPQYETTVQFLHKPLMRYLMHGEMPERMGNRDEDYRYVQGAYECAGEDRWAVVAIGDEGQWERFCRVIGRSDLVDDNRFDSHYKRLQNHDAVDEIIETWTRQRSPEEVRTRLQNHDVPAGIVADERDLMDRDLQLRTRNYFPEYDQPVVGHQRYGGIPFIMSDARASFDRYPPRFGEHTEEVLKEWLGMSEEEIRQDREEQVLQ